MVLLFVLRQKDMGNNYIGFLTYLLPLIRFVVLIFVDVLLLTVPQGALLFIWQPEGDLLIVPVNCWHGGQIVFKEMHLGIT